MRPFSSFFCKNIAKIEYYDKILIQWTSQYRYLYLLLLNFIDLTIRLLSHVVFLSVVIAVHLIIKTRLLMKNCKAISLKHMPLILLMLLILCVVLSIAACSCGDNHVYESEITKAATCDTKGEITYTCAKCGETYTEEIPAVEHDLVYRYDVNEHWQVCKNCDYATGKTSHTHDNIIQSTASSCYANGSEIKACVCGATVNNELPLTSHNFTVAQKDESAHWFKCADCDATAYVEPHAFDTELSRENATCVKEGKVVLSCECGQTKTEPLRKIDHIYDLVDYDDNFHWLVCSGCGQDKSNQVKTAHTTSSTSIGADCTHDGSVTVFCTKCDYTRTQVIPALEHDLDKTVFSKASNRSNHYYKCNRCGENIAEAHDFVDIACEDGLEREATCYKTGHKDQECQLCGFADHFTTPMTDEHNFSNEWDKNGTHHWHSCTNGDGQCDARDSQVMHTWVERTRAATCEANGSTWRECELCGYVQDGSTKTLTKLGHDYQTAETLVAVTCSQEGQELQICSRCSAETIATINRLPHDLSLYGYNDKEHWNRCANCSFEQSYKSAHTIDAKQEIIVNAGSCEEDRIVKHTCVYCKYTYTETTAAKGHNFVTEDPNNSDNSKFKDTTCTELGWHMEICTVCSKSVKVDAEQLLPHQLQYHKPKQPTLNQQGNIAYYACSMCGQYFSGTDKNQKLDESEVFYYYPQTITVDGFDNLYQYAATMENDTVSRDYYQLNAKVVEIKTSSSQIVVINVDGKGERFTIDVPNNVSIWSFKVDMILTLKFKLYVVIVDEIPLFDLEEIDIVSIVDDTNKFDLFVESNLEAADGEIVICYDGEEYAFFENVKNFNVLEMGRNIAIKYKRWSNNVELLKVLVNGKAVTANDGALELSVSGNMHIKLIFSYRKNTSVSLDYIDTSNRNELIVVDEYVSYEYVGNYNNDGHILDNSHLKFYLNNANIVGIVITYDEFSLGLTANVCDNSLYVGTDDNHKYLQEQSLNSNNKVILEFDAELGYLYVDYFADTCQARIVEITILYATNNTF